MSRLHKSLVYIRLILFLIIFAVNFYIAFYIDLPDFLTLLICIGSLGFLIAVILTLYDLE